MAARDKFPAYVVMHDATIDDLCRKLPRTHAELLHVFGIGERKAQTYGAQILAALEAYRKGARAARADQK